MSNVKVTNALAGDVGMNNQQKPWIRWVRRLGSKFGGVAVGLLAAESSMPAMS